MANFTGGVGADRITGTTGHDLIQGRAGNDILDGRNGDDVLSGESGNDQLVGGSGNDRMDGGTGDDIMIVSGSFGIDTYLGGAGTDTIRLTGDAWSTRLTVKTAGSIERLDIGEYDLSGTVGADIFDLSGLGGYTKTTVIRLGAGNDQFTGSAVTDLVDGGDGNDILKGGAGNDVLHGGSGNDQLDGGDGNDVFELVGRFDADTYLGGAGTDTIRLTGDAWSTRFTVKTTGSIERLDIGEYDLSGTVGADIFDLSGLGGYTKTTVIRLGAGNDQFTGSAVTDLVDGGDGDDILKGGAGNDVLHGGSGNDQLDGGDGNDVFELVGRFDADTYLGGAGTDTIRLTGDAWSTRFAVKTTGSIERLDIGEYDLSGTVGADIFDLSGLGGYTKTTVIRLGAGNDQFTGSAVTDLVDGGDGDDILKGGAGNDVLHGGSGNDQLDGGDGNDVFELVGRFDADTYLGGAGTDTIRLTGDAWSTRFAVKTTGSIERLDIGEYDLSGTVGADIFDLSGLGGYTKTTVIRLGAGNDQFTGSAVTDLVDGGDGNDILKGGAGNDVLHGGSGNDQLDGGDGNDVFELVGRFDADTYLGGAGTDTIRLTGDAWSTRLTVKTTGSIERLDIGEYDLSGTVGADIFDLSGLGGYTKTTVIRLGAGNDQFTGSAVTDLVDGGDGNDILKGGAGNDVLHGGSGNDQLDGGDGNDVFELVGRFDADTYLGGAGTDTIRLTGDAWSTRLTVKTTGSIERLDIGEYDLSGTVGADIFDLSGLGGYTKTTVIRLGAGNDQFTGSAVTDLVDGGDGNDILKGGAGKDQLFGNSGNDTISGGNEADLLEGGIGADRLSGGTGADRFIYTGTGDSTTAASGRDTILDFSRAGGDKIDLSAFAGTFLFIGTSGFTGKAMQLHAVSATSGLLIEGDINGDRFADFAILVAGVGSLVASDFIL